MDSKMNHMQLEDFPREEWGPIFWYEMHRMTSVYHQEYSMHYYNIISQFPLLVPCPTCSHHFSEMLKKYPIKTNSGDALFSWGVNVHNIVNKRLNKKQMSVDEAHELYSKPIEHNKIIKFLKYLDAFIDIDNNIYRLNATIIILRSFALIFPCETCRVKLTDLANNESLNNKNIHQFIEKMIKIIEKH